MIDWSDGRESCDGAWWEVFYYSAGWWFELQRLQQLISRANAVEVASAPAMTMVRGLGRLLG